MYFLEWRQIAATALVLFMLFDFTPRAHTQSVLDSFSEAEPAAQSQKSE
jgi:hypothetical protein